MTQPLHGVLAPVLTPMRDDLSPDTPKWIAFCKQLLADGCTGLAPFGTTSEANSLGLDERMEMLDALVEAGIPAELLMPGVGTCAITDTAKLAAQAARLGCGGVLMLPPFYYKGVSEEGVFRSVAEVVERVGDDRLRVYVYHIPPIAVVGFSLKVIERLIKSLSHHRRRHQGQLRRLEQPQGNSRKLPRFWNLYGLRALPAAYPAPGRRRHHQRHGKCDPRPDSKAVRQLPGGKRRPGAGRVERPA